MVRVLDIQEQVDVRSESRSTSNAQREASDLLSSLRTGRSEKPAITNGMLEFTNAFSDSSSSCSRIPNDGRGGAQGDCGRRKQFVPDKELKTPGARQWVRQSEKQRQKPLEVGEDGTYKVEKGDSLSTIAERMCRGEDGRRPNASRIRENIKRLLEANPELKCNPDLLRKGERLTIPGKEGSQEACPAPADRPRLPEKTPGCENEAPNAPERDRGSMKPPADITNPTPGDSYQEPGMDSAGMEKPVPLDKLPNQDGVNNYRPAKNPDWKAALPPPSWVGHRGSR